MEARLSGTGSDGNLFSNVADGLVGCPVGGLELGGRNVSDLTVQAPVVVPVDVSATAISTSRIDAHPPLGRIIGLRMHSALNNEFSASAIALS